MTKVRESGTSLPRRISLPKTSGRARRIRHRRSIHASYATNLIKWGKLTTLV